MHAAAPRPQAAPKIQQNVMEQSSRQIQVRTCVSSLPLTNFKQSMQNRKTSLLSGSQDIHGLGPPHCCPWCQQLSTTIGLADILSRSSNLVMMMISTTGGYRTRAVG